MIYGKKSLEVPKAIYHLEKLQQTSVLFWEMGAGSARSSRAHPDHLAAANEGCGDNYARAVEKQAVLTDLIRRNAHVT